MKLCSRRAVSAGGGGGVAGTSQEKQAARATHPTIPAESESLIISCFIHAESDAVINTLMRGIYAAQMMINTV